MAGGHDKPAGDKPSSGRRAPPDADPRRGKEPGYAEDQPRDRGDAHGDGKPPQPTPDVPGDPTGRPDDER